LSVPNRRFPFCSRFFSIAYHRLVIAFRRIHPLHLIGQRMNAAAFLCDILFDRSFSK